MKYPFSVAVLVLMTWVVSAYARDKGVCPTEEKSSVEIPQRRVPAPPFPGLHYVGTVTMRLSLSDTGYICGVEVVKGIQPELDKQAVNAIKEQIFQPILLEGKPIAGVMMIQRDFFRGDTSDTVFSENVDAASDDIPFEEKQVQAADISAIVAAGTIQNDTYLNRYFGISFSAPNSRFMKTSTEVHMRRLAEAVSATNNLADRYSIAIVADELSNYPGIKTIGQYLSSVTAQFGVRGVKTIRGKFPYLISGVHFDGVICEIADGLDAHHYRGVFTTVSRGYFLSLDIAALTENQILTIASSVGLAETNHSSLPHD